MDFLSVDFNKIYEESLAQELLWFEEELDELFILKESPFSKDDIKTANQILDKLTEKINSCNSEKLIRLLADSLSRIEKKFPQFF